MKTVNRVIYIGSSHFVLRGTYAIASSTAQTSAQKRAHFYIRFDVCASASRTDIKKLSAHNVCTQRSLWSEWRDLNSRPYGPEPYALPNCATPRYYKFAFTSTVASLGARRAFPLGLAFFTVDLKSFRILGISLVLFPLLSQTKLRTPR